MSTPRVNRAESLKAVARTSPQAQEPAAPAAAPLEIDGDEYFDAGIDFEGIEDPCVGDAEIYMHADHRGGTLENRKRKIKALRERILADKSFEECKLAAVWEDRSNAAMERFLRARSYDVEVAAALFIDHRRWRNSFNWSVHPGMMPSRLPTKVAALHGFCRQGMPLLLVIGRNHVAKGRDMDEIRNVITYTLDKITNILTPGQQFHCLVDLKGLSYANADTLALIACFDMIQARFVERCAHLWFVEPPAIFWALWKVVKRFVGPSTREKIKFLYGKEATEEVLRHFEPHVLPKEYGGTLDKVNYVDRGPALWEGPGMPRLRRY